MRYTTFSALLYVNFRTVLKYACIKYLKVNSNILIEHL